MEGFDSYVGGEEDLQTMPSARPFDGDGYMGFDPRLASQRFETFDNFGGENPYMASQTEDLGLVQDEEGEDGFSPAKLGSSNGGFNAPPVYQSSYDDDLGDGQHSSAMSSPFGQSFESRLHSEFTPENEFSPSADSNGKGFGHIDDGFGQGEDPGFLYPPPSGSLNGGSVLPPLEEMQAEEGFMLREWKRQNAIRLEEKARLEREQLSQIIDAADSYKDGFYEKRKMHCETNKNNNRDKEKVFLENLVNFHATADKHYWKAVGELIPHELTSFESRSRGIKDKDKKKPSVLVNHGPKPGKATDLTRMRQVLVKLKHNPPAHMKAPPPAPPAATPGAEGSEAKPTADPAPAPAPATATGPELLQKQASIPVVAAA
ncbi:hypothetical protein L7F22_060552 [Adiantum nelumboides]|nr:hypothetical protein [Adiantum nelumboides]